MLDQQHDGERERLDTLREEVAAKIEAAEEAFGVQSLLQPVLEWLEEIAGQLEEHEEILRSEAGDEPIEHEEVEELILWAEGFSDCLNEGGDMEEECITDEIPENISAALVHLITHHLEPVRRAGWALYHASIGAA